jgi:hypothetical protein
MQMPEPLLSLAIEPKTKADQEKLSMGLGKLMVEDPTFRVKTDDQTGQVVIAGMGASGDTHDSCTSDHGFPGSGGYCLGSRRSTPGTGARRHLDCDVSVAEWANP